MTDARQLDAFVSPSRVGELLEVARDEMLERAERGEPVAWVAVGDAGTVLHGWLATLIRRHAGGAPELWRIVRLGSGQKVRAWTTAELTKALTRAEAMLDPDSPRCLHERRHGPLFMPAILRGLSLKVAVEQERRRATPAAPAPTSGHAPPRR